MVVIIASACLLGRHLYVSSEENAKAKWWKENTHKIKSLTSDNYEDLKFLNPILKDKQYVFLGESSHGAAEYDLAKTRIIKYLHDKLGFDVLAFESGIGDVSATYADLSIDKYNENTSVDFMRNSVFNAWNSTSTRPLFDYVIKNDELNPLTLTAFDVQSMPTFASFMGDWIKDINPKYATSFLELDSKWREDFNGMSNGQKISHKEMLDFKNGYMKALKYVRNHSTELSKKYSNQKNLTLIVEKTLQERIDFMERLYKSNATPLEFSFIRDSMMSDNIQWLSEKIFPGKKIIFWAHNMHIDDNNSQISYNDELAAPSMFENLPKSFKEKSYNIGLFSHSGEVWSDDNDRIVQVNHGKKYSINDLEYYLNQSKYDSSFINLVGQEKGKYNTWMFTPTYSILNGEHRIKQVISQNFDGIIFIKKVKAKTYYRTFK